MLRRGGRFNCRPNAMSPVSENPYDYKLHSWYFQNKKSKWFENLNITNCDLKFSTCEEVLRNWSLEKLSAEELLTRLWNKFFRLLGSTMFITLQDAIVQTVMHDAPSTGVPSSATSDCSVEIYSSVTFFFMEGKKYSDKSTTILRFSEYFNC